MIRAVTRAGWEADMRGVLPLIDCPTAVLVNRDGAQAPEMARYTASLIVNARYTELPASTEVAGVADYFSVAIDEVEDLVTGGRTGARRDRILATVLFTDIVGSTELASELGDERWRVLLGRHEEILRDHIAVGGGRVVKMVGDGSLCVFDGPARGIRAAQAFADAVRTLGFEVRGGLHTGECEQIGDDLAGLAVHIGARVGALAGPGEVWVSRTVRDLVVGSGLSFVDRGTHRLKGVEGTWELASLADNKGAPIPVPPEPSAMTPADRLVLRAARRAPGLLRRLGRLQNA
ncbi:MAG: adenylate/guanylate cyclase domain-containing protein [Solirubrobacteraceae bacterium]